MTIAVDLGRKAIKQTNKKNDNDIRQTLAFIRQRQQSHFLIGKELHNDRKKNICNNFLKLLRAIKHLLIVFSSIKINKV